MAYALHVTFKSNERPWSTLYQPVSWMQPVDDASAIEWATGMAKQLDAYICVLKRDGQTIMDFESERQIGSE